MASFKTQVKRALVSLTTVAALGAAALFVLERAGIHAPGPPPISTTDASATAGSGSPDDGSHAAIAADGASEAPGLGASTSVTTDPELQAAFRQPSSASEKPAIGNTPSDPTGPTEPLITTSVRTTAYTHTEADHLKYGKKTALGTDLRYTPEYHSAAADWSRFPLGTKFRMKGSDRLFVVDDYGKALVGSRTIDIYFPTKERMNNWGVRWIDIDVVEFGNFHESRKILAARANYKHCREMLASMTSDNWWKDFR